MPTFKFNILDSDLTEKIYRGFTSKLQCTVDNFRGYGVINKNTGDVFLSYPNSFLINQIDKEIFAPFQASCIDKDLLFKLDFPNDKDVQKIVDEFRASLEKAYFKGVTHWIQPAVSLVPASSSKSSAAEFKSDPALNIPYNVTFKFNVKDSSLKEKILQGFMSKLEFDKSFKGGGMFNPKTGDVYLSSPCPLTCNEALSTLIPFNIKADLGPSGPKCEIICEERDSKVVNAIKTAMNSAYYATMMTALRVRRQVNISELMMDKVKPTFSATSNRPEMKLGVATAPQRLFTPEANKPSEYKNSKPLKSRLPASKKPLKQGEKKKIFDKAFGHSLYAGMHPAASGSLKNSLESLKKQGITRIYSLESNHSENITPIWHSFGATYKHQTQSNGISYFIPDFEAPTQAQLKEIVNQITSSIANQEHCFLHCRGGVGRTGTILAAVYMRLYNASAKVAIDFIRDNYNEYAIETEVQEEALSVFEGNEKDLAKEVLQSDTFVRGPT